MSKTPKKTQTFQFPLTLDRTRYDWFLKMCVDKRISPQKFVENLLHNAVLDYQQDHYPESHPDQTPQEYYDSREQGSGFRVQGSDEMLDEKG